MGNYKQIAVMNNTQKGWKNRDFLKHFSHSNHHNSAEYRKVAKFLDDYGLPFTVSIALLSSSAMGRGNNTGYHLLGMELLK